ncbi:hypothetical protein LCGC14_0413780 [marine sediment metagenome]|uniref:Uncharacterized protein n=1 Tax=marine sediment metagenome TaxID=412755 RepID=A0A0F9VF12_9ZZZZ
MDTKTLAKILNKDILPTLTDFKGGQLVFWEVFKQNEIIGTPIKNVLELGIMTLKNGAPPDLPGQSTKTLMVLCDYYEANKYISLDIDDCMDTIQRCARWAGGRGVKVSGHRFIKSNSIHFDVKKEFPNGADLIFLDTNHDDSYPTKKLRHRPQGHADSGGAGMTYKEICYYAPHLTRNGRLFLHDTRNRYAVKSYGVNTDGAIEKFLDHHPEFLFKEHAPNNNGLGEIYHKDSEVATLYRRKHNG